MPTGGRYLVGRSARTVSGGKASEVRWRPTEALRRASLCGLMSVVAGLLIGRADVVLLGAPLLLGVALGLARGVPPPVRVTSAVPSLLEQGGRTEVTVIVRAPAADLVAVRIPWGAVVPHGRTVVRPITREGSVTVRARVDAVGRGTVVLARPDLLALAADGLLAFGPQAGPPFQGLILPAFDRMPAGPLPPRPSGLVGGHRTRYPGDGADLLSVRPLQPGDRLRRIDWRVTARRELPHVRTTAMDSDADVVLCLDSRMDLSREAAEWAFPPNRDPDGRGREGSSLDLAVRVASTIAAAQLRHGDRVALVDLGSRQRSLGSGTGRRQFLRLRLRLASALPVPGESSAGLRPSRMPTGAVVVVLSTFVDTVAATVSINALHQGAQVIAVDVLPPDVRPDGSTPSGTTALEMVLAKRHQRLSRLRSSGVLVLPGEAEAMAAELQSWTRVQRTRR